MSTLRPDRPIRGSKADLLGRGRLVSAIAKQILDAPRDGKAITIGLNAQWGAGKSSFLNLLQQRLIREGKKNGEGATSGTDSGSSRKPIVIRFNPWLFGSIEQLTRMFFADLAREVGQREPESELGRLLERFGNLVAAASTIFPTGASELAKLLGQEARRMGIRAQKPPSLNEQKTEIDDALAGFKRRVVVFIDDVDRLEPDLTTLFFRMVRLNANFNNVIYVLAFDRQVVEQHMAHGAPGFGREYLEKIIQVSYNIPPPHPRIIPSLLKDEMVDVRRAIEKTVFAEDRYERLFDDRRYDQVFTEGFARHFNTVRSIKRYVNALRLTLPPVAGQVDLVDFYVIELIRLHYPGVYLHITQNKEMLLNESSDDETQSKRKEWVAGVRKMLRKTDTPAHLRESVQSLLYILFPDLDEAESKAGDGEAVRLQWTHERRVCSPDAFDRFFSLAEEGRDLEEVGGSVADGVGSDKAIRRLFQHARKTGQILELLNELRDRDLARNEAMRVATTICASDTRDDLQLADSESSYKLVGDVVKKCMHAYGRGDEFRFLRALIENASSLFTVSKVVEEIRPQGHVVEQNVQQLQRKLGDRVLEEARSKRFWDGNRWYYLLSVARRLDREQEVLRIVEGRMVERGDAGDSWHDDRLLRFCETFPEAVRADRERGGAATRFEDIKGWVPGDASARIRSLANGEGADGVRARAIVARLFDG